MTSFHGYSVDKTDQDHNNETYTNSVQYGETLHIRPEGISQITEYLYALLGCKESQTKSIIKKFLEDIILFDKKQHDYGPHNIAKFGTLGVLVRSSDKLERLINLYKRDEKPEVAEPITETWQDLSVYGAIARVFEDGEWLS